MQEGTAHLLYNPAALRPFAGGWCASNHDLQLVWLGLNLQQRLSVKACDDMPCRGSRRPGLGSTTNSE